MNNLQEANSISESSNHGIPRLRGSWVARDDPSELGSQFPPYSKQLKPYL
jgi:hypothetical protein